MKRKTPGQVAREAFYKSAHGELPHSECRCPQDWEAAAAAVLADQWRPVTEPPENELEVVATMSRTGFPIFCRFKNRDLSYPRWMPIPPLPQPPVDEYADLKKAFDGGATIQINAGTEQSPVWHDTPNPTWQSGYNYRVKPDEYAELKAAHAAGKVIQCKQRPSGNWIDVNPKWDSPCHNYRVKPWTLSRHISGFRPLADGEEWHRQDFTEDMLPEGYRPLLMGEVDSDDDQWFNYQDKEWMSCKHHLHLDRSGSRFYHRTTRPLPPTKEEREREEFETWAMKSGFAFTELKHRDWMFKGWQAARNQ